MIDSRTLTYLLSFMADYHEVNVKTLSRMKPDIMKIKLHNKFPFLSEAQTKHILRII